MSDIDRLKRKLEALDFNGAGSCVLMDDPLVVEALGVGRAIVFKAGLAAKFGDKARLMSVDELAKDVGRYESLAIGADKDKTLALAVAAWAAGQLGQGKKLLLIGDKRLGTESIEKFLATRLALVEKFPLKDIGRVSLWRRDDTLAVQTVPSPTVSLWQENLIPFDGGSLKLLSLPGVFARGELDEGTARLLEALKPALRPNLGLLDLACGNGIVGAFALKIEPKLQVSLTDDDLNAVASAKKTFEENKLKAAAIVCADGTAGLETDAKFDLIALNPPFHQGQAVSYHIGEKLIAQAAKVLPPGGQLFLVANIFCKYERAMKTSFPKMEVVSEDARFRVWRCQG